MILVGYSYGARATVMLLVSLMLGFFFFSAFVSEIPALGDSSLFSSCLNQKSIPFCCSVHQ